MQNITMQNDSVLNKYIRNNLDCWKTKNLNEEKLVKIIQKYRLPIVKMKIKNGNISILNLFNTKINIKMHKTIVFLSDIIKIYPSLNVVLYINTRDTLYNEKINIYNINGTKGNPKNLNDFVWGVLIHLLSQFIW